MSEPKITENLWGFAQPPSWPLHLPSAVAPITTTRLELEQEAVYNDDSRFVATVPTPIRYTPVETRAGNFGIIPPKFAPGSGIGCKHHLSRAGDVNHSSDLDGGNLCAAGNTQIEFPRDL
jgi:hypothetical protein